MPIDLIARAGYVGYRRELMEAIRTATKGMLRPVGARIVERAKKRVPSPENPSPPREMTRRDGSTKLVPRKTTGHLRDSIKASVRKARNEDTQVVTIKTGPGKNGYRYGLDVEIGHFVGKYHNTPYMRPAYAETLPEVPGLLEEGAAKEAAKQARKRGRPKKI